MTFYRTFVCVSYTFVTQKCPQIIAKWIKWTKIALEYKKYYFSTRHTPSIKYITQPLATILELYHHAYSQNKLLKET